MHANVPVRFGRGRLDSLGNKGLAAYLIARFIWGTGARRSGSTSGRWSPPTRPASVGGGAALDNLGRASALVGEPRKATG